MRGWCNIIENPKQFFETIVIPYLEAKPGRATRAAAVFRFVIAGARGGTWTLDLRPVRPTCCEGEAGEADLVIAVGDDDFVDAVEDPQVALQLFEEGRLKLEGDTAKATALQEFLFSLME